MKYIPFLVVACLMALVLGLGWHRYLTLETLVANREILRLHVEAHWFAALAAYAVAYVAAVALSLPGGALFTIAGGAIFGALAGGMVAVVSATAGAILVFQIARTALGGWMAQRAGPRLSRLISSFRHDAASYLLFLRLVPAFPFAFVNLAPALAGIRLWTFAWTTFVGIIPGTLAFAFAGAGLDHVVARHAAARQACQSAAGQDCARSLGLKDFVTPELLLAIAVLGVAALIPVAGRRIWGAGKTHAAEQSRG